MAKRLRPPQPYAISIDGLPVTVIRKPIKHFHLAVYPPDGRVRISAPLRATDDDLHRVLEARREWIGRQQARIAARMAPLLREYVSGEKIHFLGDLLTLTVVEENAPPKILLDGDARLELHVRPGSSIAQRERVLYAWYCRQLEEILPALVAKWSAILGVEVREVRLRRMKTRWGSCNIARRRIWINVELARKALPYLEYIVVHELMHLREAGHTRRFKELMDRYLPGWRQLRRELDPG